jgi:hypothetical protein
MGRAARGVKRKTENSEFGIQDSGVGGREPGVNSPRQKTQGTTPLLLNSCNFSETAPIALVLVVVLGLTMSFFSDLHARSAVGCS